MSLLLISQAYADADAISDDDSELAASECPTVLRDINNDKNLPSSAQDEMETTSYPQKVRARKSKTTENIFKGKAKTVRYPSDCNLRRVQTRSKRRQRICRTVRNKISLTLPANEPSKSKASKENEVAISPNKNLTISQADCLETGNEIEKISYLNPKKDDSITVFGNGFLHRPTFSDLVNCTEMPPQNKLLFNESSKVCKDLKGLQKHQNTHKIAGVGKPFPCVKCDCYFRNQNELAIHEENSVHKEEVGKSTEVILLLNKTKAVRKRREITVTESTDIQNDCVGRNVKKESWNHKNISETKKLDHPNLKRAIVRVKRCDDVVQLYLNKEAADSKKTVQSETTTSSTVSKKGIKPFECPDKKPFKCAICTKSFARNDNKQKHQRSHTGEKSFECLTCAKLFSLKKTLVIHQRTHTGEKPFQCMTCFQSFSHRDTLVQHQRTHTGEKPFKCLTCEKSFAQKCTLVNHQRTHSGEKPFTCLTCAKSFAQRAAFLIHQRTHTGERPYTCLTCNKSFTQRATFLEHQRTHTGEKLFKCLSCAKSFARRDTLLQHQRIHTGEKPFRCLTCAKSFAQRATLLQHHRTHTPGKC